MFEERERGFEAKWAHDEELLFQIMAKRDAGLGEWAAGLMRLSAPESATYVQTVINAGLTRKASDPVLEKIRADFTAHGVVCADAALFNQATKLFERAKDAILKGRKTP